MARCEKHLLLTYEDLSSNPRVHIKPDTVVCLQSQCDTVRDKLVGQLSWCMYQQTPKNTLSKDK